MTGASVNRSVVWLTNLQAPYRESMWRALAERVRLHVLFLAAENSERAWQYEERDWYESTVLRTVELPFRSADQSLYLSLSPPGRHLARADALVLGSWESPAYLQFFARAKLGRIPTVGFMEVGVNTSRFGPETAVGRLRHRFFSSVDSVLTSGETSTSVALGMGVPPDAIVTGFNSVDVDQFRSHAAAVRKDVPATESSSGHRFLFIGRMLPRKRPLELVDAFSSMAEPNDTLTLIGGGPLEQDVQRRAAADERIRVLGSVPDCDVVAHLANHHTLVLPSERETWGMVVNEALAAGLHVVSTENVGAARSVAGMRGVFVCGDEPRALAVGLAASRQTWTGYIADPEIMAFGPERAAEFALQAVERAIARQGAT